MSCLSPSWAETLIFCDVTKGLELINQEFYSEAQVANILADCDKISPNKTEVLLLHGLDARKKAQYLQAIAWLEKAKSTEPDNLSIALELSNTYVLAKNLAKATSLYQAILLGNPHNRAALLGLARLYRLDNRPAQAALLYQRLLKQDEHDIDALNGLGWVKASEKELAQASFYFQKTLSIQPDNQEALTALAKINLAETLPFAIPSLCSATEGLILLNKEHPPLSRINDILHECEKNHIRTTDSLLLQGLLARKIALKTNKNYQKAIFWLQQALQSAENKDQRPALELATTYEWANQFKEAEAIYQNLLKQENNNRIALLGLGRTLRMMYKFDEATLIYKEMLAVNPKDIDALIGLGWVELGNNHLNLAIQFFEKSLNLQPNNQEAILGLKKAVIAKSKPKPPPLAAADRGLMLLNQKNPPIPQIQALLWQSDCNDPNTASNLMLHGLLARYFKNYPVAITWLKRAVQSAKPGDYGPAFELAVTYEWATELNNALWIYQEILFSKPDDRVALLGKARVLRALYKIAQAKLIYEQLLKKSPEDTEALNGYGETLLVNYQFKQARAVFNEALRLSPKNKQTAADIQLLNKATSHILAVTWGHYVVPPNNADGINIYYFKNLNATDGLTLFATHNNRQIESGFGTGPTLLPSNSLLVGYQRILPKRYSWQISYDGRQHDGHPFEHRAFGLGNLFLANNLEVFGGSRLIGSKPWNIKLFLSGLTLYTHLPVNITATGYWAQQQIGGYTSSYVLDLSKEYNNRLYYDIGMSYLPQQLNSWEVHGKLILPIFNNLSLVGECSHYFFNNSTFATVGWRTYWA